MNQTHQQKPVYNSVKCSNFGCHENVVPFLARSVASPGEFSIQVPVPVPEMNGTKFSNLEFF
jgi:hypothetical protein